MTGEQMERILRAGMQAPSAHNLQPWEFILVREAKTKEQLASFSPYAGPAAHADILILTLADLSTMKSDQPWWIQDMSACTQNILLQIAQEGLGGVWLGWYPNEERVEKTRALFDLPAHIMPFSLIALGHAAAVNDVPDRFRPSKIHQEGW